MLADTAILESASERPPGRIGDVLGVRRPPSPGVPAGILAVGQLNMAVARMLGGFEIHAGVVNNGIAALTLSDFFVRLLLRQIALFGYFIFLCGFW